MAEGPGPAGLSTDEQGFATVGGRVLVCPRCRHDHEGSLRSAPLVEAPSALRCAGCGWLHPVVDGVPIVVRDTETWLASELPLVLCRQDLAPGQLEALALRGGGPLWRSLERRRSYRSCLEEGGGPLGDWLRAEVGRAPGPVLDLGGGIGWHGRADSVALELDWLLLGDHPGMRVLGDALAPPFRPGSFPTVLLANLLDSVADPAALLHQAHELLAPGGTLLLTTPFQWQREVTPPEAWLDEQALCALLERHGYQGELSHHDWILSPSPGATLRYTTTAFRGSRSA